MEVTLDFFVVLNRLILSYSALKKPTLFNSIFCSISKIYPEPIQWISNAIAAEFSYHPFSQMYCYIVSFLPLSPFHSSVSWCHVLILNNPMASCGTLNKIQAYSHGLQSLHDLALPNTPTAFPALPHTLSPPH